MLNILKDTAKFKSHISKVLDDTTLQNDFFTKPRSDMERSSAVLFLLGNQRCEKGLPSEPCLILNKRSIHVRQAGDLCCPGGGIKPRLDTFISKILRLPLSPLVRWRYWRSWSKSRPEEARQIALLFATSLRESVEEMRLNPMGVELLGTLPPLDLPLSSSYLYPVVSWIHRQIYFFPNQEVEKIIRIPLQNLLDSSFYARYKLEFAPKLEKRLSRMPEVLSKMKEDYPCFILQNQSEKEVLWGATYRIVISFLELVFEFKPPEKETLPVVSGTLDENYYTGTKR